MTEVTTDKVAAAMATVDREMGQLPRRFANGNGTTPGNLPEWLEHIGKRLAAIDARLAKVEKFLGV